MCEIFDIKCQNVVFYSYWQLFCLCHSCWHSKPQLLARCYWLAFQLTSKFQMYPHQMHNVHLQIGLVMKYTHINSPQILKHVQCSDVVKILDLLTHVLIITLQAIKCLVLLITNSTQRLSAVCNILFLAQLSLTETRAYHVKHLISNCA